MSDKAWGDRPVRRWARRYIRSHGRYEARFSRSTRRHLREHVDILVLMVQNRNLGTVAEVCLYIEEWLDAEAFDYRIEMRERDERVRVVVREDIAGRRAHRQGRES